MIKVEKHKFEQQKEAGSKIKFLRTRTTYDTYDLRPEKKLLLTLPLSEVRPGSNPITSLT